MRVVELLLVAIGLSMDAFAVSVCQGLKMRKVKYKDSLIIALFFGGFQAAMPVIGWALGKQFERYITSVDHWIAFALLGIIGINMVREALKKEDAECEVCKDVTNDDKTLDLKELTMLAVATSIDALAVGITFAFLKVDIVPAASFIGIITFLVSLVGILIGKIFGARYKNKAELLGGIILILIGLKILLEHLGVLK